MQWRKRFHPAVEQLEDRWVPATVKLVGGNLYISNPFVGGTGVVVKATANNTFTVTDNGAALGTYAVGGTIFYTGSNAADTLSLDVAGKMFTGNLFVNSGNGNDMLNVVTTVDNGRIGGNLTFLSGFGDDNVFVNAEFTPGFPVPPIAVQTAISIGGSIQVTDSTGKDNVFITNSVGATKIGGSLTTNGVELTCFGVGFSVPDVIGGDLNVTNTSGLDVDVPLGAPQGTILGNVSVTSGAGADELLLGNKINGRVTANLGAGADSFTVNQTSVVGGTTNVATGAGDDVFTINNDPLAIAGTPASFGGSVLLDAGDGTETFDFQATPGVATFGGDLTIRAGNGDTTIANLQAAVNGALTINLGNGNNTVTVTATVGGKLTWRSGNGVNNLTVGGAATATYLLDVLFGSNDDTFSSTATTSLTGTVDGGGRLTANTFNQNGATLLPTFVLINFP